MKRLALLLIFVLQVVVLCAQQRITGIVLTDGDVPIIGASVSVEGTTLGTVTDEQGRFEISADAGATLIVSYAGYAQTAVVVSDSRELRIMLLKSGPLTTHHRLAAWGQVGMIVQPEAFAAAEGAGQFTNIGGIVGLGYQLRHRHLLLTTGVELASINYHLQYTYESTGIYDESADRIDIDCRRLQLQVPVLAGMEMQHWYWQAGMKFGFFSYYFMYNKHLGIRPEDFNRPYGPDFAFAPTLEAGYNHTSPRDINYKVAVFADAYFDVKHQLPRSETAYYGSSNQGAQFCCILFGLKLGIAY